jgi:hypothetical protein
VLFRSVLLVAGVVAVGEVVEEEAAAVEGLDVDREDLGEGDPRPVDGTT